MEFAATVTAGQAERSREIAAAARAWIRTIVPPGAIVAMPTAPSIAPLLAATGDALEQFRMRTMRLTCIAGIAGLPQITLPIGTVSGCPAGLSFIGWPNGDEALLDLACEIGHLCGICID
jgi:amidase